MRVVIASGIAMSFWNVLSNYLILIRKQKYILNFKLPLRKCCRINRNRYRRPTEPPLPYQGKESKCYLSRGGGGGGDDLYFVHWSSFTGWAEFKVDTFFSAICYKIKYKFYWLAAESWLDIANMNSRRMIQFHNNKGNTGYTNCLLYIGSKYFATLILRLPIPLP